MCLVVLHEHCVYEQLSMVSYSSLHVSSQEGQSAGPPPLIPGLGQQGAQGRIPPLNPGQGPGPNKGKYMFAEEEFLFYHCHVHFTVISFVGNFTVALELLRKLLCLLLS